jgi:dephospho-CoA kinase
MSGAGKIIGLTGSIGMGKTTTARIFARAGIPVWDADATVHKLYGKNGAAIAGIRAIHPSAIVAGEVNRDALKQWITRDDTALKKIEQVVHPLVAADRAKFIAENSGKTIVLDIPLLFETGANKTVDYIVVASIDPGTQRARVLARPGMTNDQFEAILAKQVPDAEKRAQADFIVETTTPKAAQRQVLDILQEINDA